MYLCNSITEPLTWATRLEQAWTRVQHLQACDSSKQSHLSGYAPARFGLGRIGCAPKRSPRTAQGQPIFKHVIILCCWAEPRSCLFPLFHGLGQYSNEWCYCVPIYFLAKVKLFMRVFGLQLPKCVLGQKYYKMFVLTVILFVTCWQQRGCRNNQLPIVNVKN